MLLAVAVLTIWNWAVADEASTGLWAVIDACFIGFPILYLIMCKTCKSAGDIKLNPVILSIMTLIGVVTAYQLLNGQFGVATNEFSALIWNYLDAIVVIFYSYIAGRGLH